MVSRYYSFDYDKIFDLHSLDQPVVLMDHLNGFDQDLQNPILEHLDQISTSHCEVLVNYLFDDSVKKLYPNLDLVFHHGSLLSQLQLFTSHSQIKFEKFLCSFNRFAHVSRKLLVSALYKFGYFDPTTCSKHFEFSQAMLEGHLQDYLSPELESFYRHFFIGSDTYEFGNRISIIDFKTANHHASNIYNCEPILTKCFLHLVSETMATSYFPFVTEKFLYSVVTRGLFLAYGQPGWHDHLEQRYGFRKYNKIFNYQFDAIKNPVERLVELLSMISKFSVLSADDWRDLYEIEKDTIEHNYDWYFSKKWMEFSKVK